MTSPPQRPAETFSPDAQRQLTEALLGYLNLGDPMRHVALAKATKRLCKEAHERQLRPEQMLIAVKAVWFGLPEVAQISRERAQIAWDRVLTGCLQAYYDDKKA